eukprot:CAMPEP_0167769270 /NCGR_PEP_ID=MMETSP0110_2-20121227/17206_1 /TAXON_ID=629695 /ORGANISM="Gymnochlora sp., Strain CCMP2014" /LENGTH=111 /DNA_ID=CAMNT_0007658189 /DNA_START=600 /DNA_END=931 /DNA_ORIENTATION=+
MGFVLHSTRKFEERCFPGYRHQTTLKDAAETFESRFAVTRVFVLPRDLKDSPKTQFQPHVRNDRKTSSGNSNDRSDDDGDDDSDSIFGIFKLRNSQRVVNTSTERKKRRKS